MDKRAQTIQSMFADIADSYDKANSVLSFGIHHLWKKKLVNKTPVKQGDSILDCATGTGDLALLFKKRVGNKGQVIGTDFCQEMLNEAPHKANKQNLDVTFKFADVTQLPFDNDKFHGTSISFGIRNVNNRKKAFEEMARVTKANGNVMILEFGQVKIPVVKQGYNFYSTKVLPWLGGLVSGKPKAYQYLNDSSQVFPCDKDFKQEIMDTGLYSDVEITSLSFGVAYIYKCAVK